MLGVIRMSLKDMDGSLPYTTRKSLTPRRHAVMLESWIKSNQGVLGFEESSRSRGQHSKPEKERSVFCLLPFDKLAKSP